MASAPTDTIASGYGMLFDEIEYDNDPGQIDDEKTRKQREKAKLAQRERRKDLKARSQEQDELKRQNKELTFRNLELQKIIDELRRKIDDHVEHIRSLQTSLSHVNRLLYGFGEKGSPFQGPYTGSTTMAPRVMRPSVLSPISPDYPNRRT